MSQLYSSAAWVNGVVRSVRVDLFVGGYEKGHLPLSHEDWGVRLHMGKGARLLEVSALWRDHYSFWTLPGGKCMNQGGLVGACRTWRRWYNRLAGKA